MTLESFYSVLLAADVGASARLYTEHRGFAPSFESDWCVSLGHGENHTYEWLAIIPHDHGIIPESFGRPTSTAPLNFEMSGVEGEYGQLQAAGVEIFRVLEKLPTGQRHFICRAPGGVTAGVIQVIQPSPEFTERC